MDETPGLLDQPEGSHPLAHRLDCLVGHTLVAWLHTEPQFGPSLWEALFRSI